MLAAFKSSQGSGLLEMMISLMISAILLIEIFRYTYFLENCAQHSSNKLEFVEKENILFSWVAQDIEKAGYIACVDAKARQRIIDDTGSLPPVWLSAAKNKLFAQYMSTEHFPLVEIISTNEMIIEGGSSLKVNDRVILANCHEAQVLKIMEIHSLSAGAQMRIVFYSSIKIAESSAAIYMARLIQHNYFIQKKDKKNAAGEFIFSLYRRDERNSSDEILENIQSISFSFSQNICTITMQPADATDPIKMVVKAYNA